MALREIEPGFRLNWLIEGCAGKRIQKPCALMTSVRYSAASKETRPAPSGDVGEIFRVFLRLGLTSFGGPIAHLGYFRAEFVERRRWLSEQGFADLVALAQFLPGPAASQTGFGGGLLRGGPLGGLAASAGLPL